MKLKSERQKVTWRSVILVLESTNCKAEKLSNFFYIEVEQVKSDDADM